MYSVGKLAELTGVSKRTLHYYDEIGLLKPDKMLENGYREYGERELIRLQQILLLKSLGYSLKQILNVLHDQTHSLNEAEEMVWARSLQWQISVIDQKQKELERQRVLLQSVLHAIGTSGKLEAKELILLLQELQKREVVDGVIPPYFSEKEYTSSEIETLSNLPIMGSEDPRTQEYIALLSEIRSHMNASPESEEVQRLAERLWEWALAMFGGNVELLEKYWSSISADSSLVYGHDSELVAYIEQMMEVYLNKKEKDDEEG
ncbi:MerR family transcriptional regulator [Bacillus horti]|uniref:DNA-binding transcriptional MerR regulator n=1 Tax=Caldalkalibacillus horti TaxID=77523 RepID=A0ABT9VVB1_9BACI|nr:MerR family transcriptional regulator [Bacillus horti]MDQ0164932.1 DNA-binding transcriptional MerR regulator [Bacillus horti]